MGEKEEVDGLERNPAREMNILLFLFAFAGGASFLPRFAHAGDEGVSSPFHHLFESVAGDVENTSAPVEVLGVGANAGIPSWLHATKMNNGFGKFEGEGFTLNYLFDVMAYVHKWRIDGNSVSFSNKFIQSTYFQDSYRGIPAYRTFGGTTPPMTKVERIETLAHLLSDNLNVNIQKFGERVIAISDMAGGMEISEANLDTLGLIEFNDTISGRLSMITCAHPSKLPDEPYWYNYYVDVFGNMPHFKQPSKYSLYRIDVSGGKELKREVVMEIPIDSNGIVYMHSFAQTSKYIIFFEFPLHWEIMNIVLSERILPDMKWMPKNGTRVRVISKESWKVVKEYTMKAFLRTIISTHLKWKTMSLSTLALFPATIRDLRGLPAATI